MIPPAFEPRALATARVVAEHVRTRSEARDDFLDRAIHLLLISDIRGEPIHISRDGRRRRRKFAIDHRDFVDNFFLEQRIHDSKPKSARAASNNRVFHIPSPTRGSAKAGASPCTHYRKKDVLSALILLSSPQSLFAKGRCGISRPATASFLCVDIEEAGNPRWVSHPSLLFLPILPYAALRPPAYSFR